MYCHRKPNNAPSRSSENSRWQTVPRLVSLGLYLALCCTSFVPGSGFADENVEVTAVPPGEDAPQGGNFSLQSTAGQMSLSDLNGSAVLLAFGFTHCPDVCPATLSFLTSALEALDKSMLERTKALFITLDPERDSTIRMEEYTRYFHDNIIGLTGTEDEIASVARQYGVRYATVAMEDSPIEYTINHSAAIYLINSAGELQFVFPYMTPPSVLTEAVEHVLSSRTE
jgi:protein SCO1/2